MVNYPKNLIQYLCGILLLAMLTACGSKSSSTPTTIPNAATIYYAHNLVFLNNTTLSTGYNGFGQLGTGNLGSRTAPGPLASYYPFSGFALGSNHAVAFINNSTVRSWGYNGFGQLGNNSTTYSSIPVPVFSIISGAKVNLTGIKAVAAGAYHTLALKNDDTLWAWGKNDLGELGVDINLTRSTGYSMVPVKQNAAGVILSNISSISANSYHSLARASGSVWAWGYNGSGQIGIDPKTTAAIASPKVVTGLPTDGINYIASGGAFNYAVGRNGTIWAWGNNDNGQLGNNSTVASYRPVQVMKASGGPLTGVVKAAAGIQHGLALLDNGELWAWGYNFFGQLGNNGKLDSHVAQQVMADTAGNPFAGVTEIRAFGSSSMAKVGSAWYVWGDNTFGQLGLVSTGIIPLPVKMTGF